MNERTQTQAKPAKRTPPTPARSGSLRHKCGCGGIPGLDGVCTECRGKRLSSQRFVASDPANRSGVPPIVEDPHRLSQWPPDAGTRASVKPSIGHDFSRIPVYAGPPPTVQPKLAVSVPGDRYEQEADRVADRVTRFFEPRSESSRLRGGMTPGSGYTEVQTKRVEADNTGESSAPPVVGEVVSSPGQPLDQTARDFAELRFGRDFNRVRIHMGSRADYAARSIRARAFTLGHHIVFGVGQYAPNTAGGRWVLAHELTHVLQQNGDNRAHRIQRLGDPSQVPGGFACPVASSTPGGVHVHVLFEVGSATLSPGGLAAIDNLVDDWHAAGAYQDLRLDGYASAEGSDPLNWNLSCSRVMAVENALKHPSGGRTGIPASFIEVFAQGETSEFAITHPPNPRVTVQLQGGVPTSTPAPVPPTTVVPCTTLPTQIFGRGGCGSGTDFTFNDFPSLSGVGAYGRALVWQADNLSFDFRLRNDMRLELGLLGGSEGLRMVTHFSGGSGTRLTHGPTSTLGTDALGSGTFSSLHSAVVRELEGALSRMDAAGVIDCNAIALSPAGVPAVSFGFSDTALKGIIGGTQGLRVLITHFTVTPGSRTYDIGLQYLICDDFGVDTSDLYSPGLAAFWVLQHRRCGHRPFINELDLPATAAATY